MQFNDVNGTALALGCHDGVSTYCVCEGYRDGDEGYEAQQWCTFHCWDGTV